MATQQFKTQAGVSLSSSSNYLEDQWIGSPVYFVKHNFDTSFTVIEIIDGRTVKTSENHGLKVNDMFIARTTANGFVDGSLYFIVAINDLNTFELSAVYSGGTITNFESGTGLTIILDNRPIDYIGDGVAITRGDDGGIYNPLSESGWSSGTSPQYTEWNAEGWDDLSDTVDRTYATFYDCMSGGALGNQVVGTEFIMHDTNNDNYYTVQFHTWQQGVGEQSLGGGISYTRRQINPNAFFNHPDDSGSSVFDFIYEGSAPGYCVAITREIGQYPGSGGIYNPYTEPSGYDQATSPGNTAWNSEGWDDLSNVESRQYVNWESAVKGEAGQVITGMDFVMRATISDGTTTTYDYYTIKFTEWTSGGAGGFRYTRKKINTLNPAIGLKFGDGTVQTTAITTQRLGIIPTVTYDNSSLYYITQRDIGKQIILYSQLDIYIPDYTADAIPDGSVITIINLSGTTCGVYKDNNNEGGTIYSGVAADNRTHWGLSGQGIYTLLKLKTYFDVGLSSDWMIAGPSLENYC